MEGAATELGGAGGRAGAQQPEEQRCPGRLTPLWLALRLGWRTRGPAGFGSRPREGLTLLRREVAAGASVLSRGR